MLKLNDLAIRRGTRVLFEHASVTLTSGQRVGIVGANGSGKSSLFELILGQIEADHGELEISASPVIAHVAQHLECDSRDAVEHTLDGDVELRQIEARMAASGSEALSSAAGGRDQARFEEIDGYGAEARAARLLSGLGFDSTRMRAPANTLSGGWQMRINLARALMCRSDLLLLDEPTNHLDLDAVIWLENWLRRYPGTLLLISHDREFLDRIVQRIVAIENRRVTDTTGNYSDYEATRAARLAQQHAAHRKQQREVAHIHSFVTRFRAKASKARQAQSRLKALERMELIAPAHIDSSFHFDFLKPAALPDPLIRLDDVSIGYGGNAIIESIKLSISPGDRLGLLGLNGAGKTTFSRLLAGRLPLMAGHCVLANRFDCGYFAQSELDLLRFEETPAELFGRLFKLHDQQALRNFLGGFGFSGDRVFEKIAPFSGGEKARLVLATVVYSRPNLLILDEPTNHLDIDMRLALTRALQSFEGAVVLVSHDRHLLRATADRLLLVDSGVISEFNGDLDDYPKWLATRRRREATIPATIPVGSDHAPETVSAEALTRSPDNAGESTNHKIRTVNPGSLTDESNRRDQRRRQAEQRARLKPMSDRVRKLEGVLDRLHQERDEMDKRLADGDLYESASASRLTALLKDQGTLNDRLERAESELLEAMEALEAAQSSDASLRRA
ncbi:MAG: ABC transporter ATP-binding protein [marine bacterium B5-7]|nr:MAG: ABC transporter ATP-binding protein [marine bacterium B5-7]